MQVYEAKALLNKYIAGNCTEEEKAVVERWYYNLKDDGLDLTQERIDDIGESIWQNLILDKKSYTVFHWPRLTAAAIILIAFSIGSYFYFSKEQKISQKSQYVNDIQPGGNKAVLTLADGKKIILDNTGNGNIAEQSGISIFKTADGQLTYTISNPGDVQGPALYNTIKTPNGGQYQVNLPDGTKVWLNSATSLRYPTRFTGSERKVEIIGEAYFEVAHNDNMPFKVFNESQMVEVLGTHFNVTAYPDDKSINTTLLEGSVKVKSGTNTKFLIPGQQSQVYSGHIVVIDNADIEEAVSWKNGYFKFNESLESIMGKIARWYNVEVIYQIKPEPDLAFGGKISRAKNLSAVLKIMELTGNVHFKVEGRRITVMR